MEHYFPIRIFYSQGIIPLTTNNLYKVRRITKTNNDYHYLLSTNKIVDPGLAYIGQDNFTVNIEYINDSYYRISPVNAPYYIMHDIRERFNLRFITWANEKDNVPVCKIKDGNLNEMIEAFYKANNKLKFYVNDSEWKTYDARYGKYGSSTMKFIQEYERFDRCKWYEEKSICSNETLFGYFPQKLYKAEGGFHLSPTLSPSYNFLVKQNKHPDDKYVTSLRGMGTRERPYRSEGMWPPEFTLRIIQLIDDFGLKIKYVNE